MKKAFVITQVRYFYKDSYDKNFEPVAIRFCTLEEIEAEVAKLKNCLAEDWHSFNYSELPVEGFSKEFILPFNDVELAEQSFRNNVPGYYNWARNLQKRGDGNEKLALKDVFMSIGEVMDLYFNTALTKETASRLFDEYVETLNDSL